MNQTEIRYAFSTQAFRILVSAAGIEYLACFAEADKPEEDPPEKYQAELFSLVKRGLIEIREEQYHLNQICSDMVCTIRDRKKMMLLRGEDLEEILYLTEKNAVAATPGRKKDEYIFLEYLKQKDLDEHIKNILPENLFPQEILDGKKDMEDFPDSGEEILSIELMDIKDEIRGKYGIFRKDDYLYYTDEKESEVYLYQKEEFMGKLISECREEK